MPLCEATQRRGYGCVAADGAHVGNGLGHGSASPPHGFPQRRHLLAAGGSGTAHPGARYGSLWFLGVLCAALNSLGRASSALALTLVAVVFATVGCTLAVPRMPFGPSMLVASSTATSLALTATAVLAGALVRRVAGGVVSPQPCFVSDLHSLSSFGSGGTCRGPVPSVRSRGRRGGADRPGRADCRRGGGRDSPVASRSPELGGGSALSTRTKGASAMKGGAPMLERRRWGYATTATRPQRRCHGGRRGRRWSPSDDDPGRLARRVGGGYRRPAKTAVAAEVHAEAVAGGACA